jgi:AraC-like DNA-binding protein|nr:AraC family transcriptional regulator [Kofleriaceae bacterium]
MLVATSEVRLGRSSARSTLVLERAIRGHAIVRDDLAYDTRFAAAAAGRAEQVGHLFLLARGRFVPDRGGAASHGPLAVLLADDELERVHDRSRTFRTDGSRVEAVQLRIATARLRVPVGLAEGPIELPAAAWDAAATMLHAPNRADAVAALIDALAMAGVVDRSLAATVHADEPEHFRRLWDALAPLYREHGGGTSLKQLAASLDMSLRQVGRDAKELAETFGVGAGFRDALLVLRLRSACLLLSAPDATVAEVARVAGYGSPIAMARAFRDARLPSPSGIQESVRLKPQPPL